MLIKKNYMYLYKDINHKNLNNVLIISLAGSFYPTRQFAYLKNTRQ